VKVDRPIGERRSIPNTFETDRKGSDLKWVTSLSCIRGISDVGIGNKVYAGMWAQTVTGGGEGRYAITERDKVSPKRY